MQNVPEPHSGSTSGVSPAPAALQEQAGRQRLVQRRDGLDRAVAALVQRIPGAIEAEHRVVLVDVQVEADHRPLDIDARPPADAFAELVADGVLDPPRRVLRVRDGRVADVAIDGERVVGRQVLAQSMVRTAS